MALHDLMREYEERRQALVDKLKNDPGMDAATQHQIYGAIKEIEHFIQALETQLAHGQEEPGIELSRERTPPLGERTRGAMGRAIEGPRKVVREHIPNLARKVTAVPRRFMEQRREQRRMREEVEREVRARMQQDAARSGALPDDVRTDMRAVDNMIKAPVPPMLEPQHSSTAGESEMRPEIDETPSMEPTRKQTAAQRLVKASPMTRKGVLSRTSAAKRPGKRLPALSKPSQAKAKASKAAPVSSRPLLVHKGAPLGEHPKRAKDLLHHAKGKTHPGKHAKSNTGGQHKPHQKKGRRFRK